VLALAVTGFTAPAYADDAPMRAAHVPAITSGERRSGPFRVSDRTEWL
jgi:hypothetical protein